MQNFNQIVKVQRPLNIKDNSCLIYDEDRRHTTQQALSPGDLAKMGDKMKAFFFAVWVGKYWQFGGLAPWQDW